MTPMLICIPFWKGDMPQAFDLCKILAGLQTGHVGSFAHILLVARQDCAQDPNMIKIVMSKFNTFTHTSRSPMKGWPNGPNGMFGSTMIHISQNNKKNQYDCVYWMEPDAIPLCPNWFVDLHNAWKGRHIKCLVMGNRGDCNGDGTGDHITGCAMYHPNIARLMPKITSCSGQAWDYKYRADIVAAGAHTPLIENWYNQRNAPIDICERAKEGVRIVHGFKDRSVVISVATKFKININ